jgi:hypothetical protein
MVYTHLVCPVGDVVMGYRHPSLYSGPYDLSRHPQPTFWAMDPAFVGADIAKEVAAVYISNNRRYELSMSIAIRMGIPRI